MILVLQHFKSSFPKLVISLNVKYLEIKMEQLKLVHPLKNY